MVLGGNFVFMANNMKIKLKIIGDKLWQQHRILLNL